MRLFVTFLCSLLALHVSSGSIPESDTIEGRIVLPKGVFVPFDTYITLFSPSEGSRRRKVFPNEDGRFQFHGVQDGTHSLQVESIPFHFSAIKIVKKGKDVKATASDVQDASVPYPLKLSPLQVMSYFEQKPKFNIMKWLKTPYGIMIAFGLFSVVLLPMLKVDPEEYRQMREAIKTD
jgi:ER membrane protein complex subunit 7